MRAGRRAASGPSRTCAQKMSVRARTCAPGLRAFEGDLRRTCAPGDAAASTRPRRTAARRGPATAARHARRRRSMRAALNDQLRAFHETSRLPRRRRARGTPSRSAARRGRAASHVTRESAEAMRSALNEQLRALEQLSSLRPRAPRRHPAGAAAAAAPAARGTRPCRPARRAAAAAAFAAEGGERWSLGDLLARASRDDDGIARAAHARHQGIARALDPTTASAIWSRFRAGQRGIMVRSIYTAEGRRASMR